jgi:hypothetical protein
VLSVSPIVSRFLIVKERRLVYQSVGFRNIPMKGSVLFSPNTFVVDYGERLVVSKYIFRNKVISHDVGNTVGIVKPT